MIVWEFKKIHKVYFFSIIVCVFCYTALSPFSISYLRKRISQSSWLDFCTFEFRQTYEARSQEIDLTYYWKQHFLAKCNVTFFPSLCMHAPIEDNIFWPSVMLLSFHPLHPMYASTNLNKQPLWGDPNKNCHKHKSFRRHLVQPTHDKVRRDQLLIPCEWQRQMDFFSQFSVFGCCAYIVANYKGGIVCK